MSDFHDEPGAPLTADFPTLPETVTDPAPERVVLSDADVLSVQVPEKARQEAPEDPSVTRFKSCRWHETQDKAPSYCSNRDVLPFAGKNGFNSEAWCPDCSFYKVKRIVKKRNPNDWDGY